MSVESCHFFVSSYSCCSRTKGSFVVRKTCSIFVLSIRALVQNVFGGGEPYDLARAISPSAARKDLQDENCRHNVAGY